MGKRQMVGSLAVVVILSLLGPGRTVGNRGPSTPEERARFVDITHKLENNPLDRNLDQERDWALRWLIEVPDVHALLCSDVLGDFPKEKNYKYQGEVVRQLTFSGAAMTIEDPSQANDKLAQYNAAVKGALKAYQSILKVRPEAHSKSLDAMVDKQTAGTLSDFVRTASQKGCK